jgi:hypothetical protein
MPTLPTGLEPVASNYSGDDPGGVMRTEVAGGAARYALDWDRGPQRYTITMILTALQFSVWTAFFRHTIKKGAIAFDLPIDTGFGVDTHSANIMPGTYSEARTSDILTVVSFTVEAESQAYDMTAEDAVNLVDLYNEYGEQSNALLAALAQFALIDSLVLDFA